MGNETQKGKYSSTFVKILTTIGYGDLLVRLRVHKLLPFILYAFFLAMVSILMSYKVEQTMLKVEKNKLIIENKKIIHSHMVCNIVSLDRISTVETMLEELGSDVKPPEKPADILKK